MRSTSRLLGALALAGLVLAASAPVEAQQRPQHRNGFWLSGGLGGGLDEDGDSGGAGYVRLGGTLGSHFSLGGEAIGFTRDAGDDVTLSRGNVTASALFFPSPDDGFFLKAGLGFASAERTVESGDLTVTESDDGFGTVLGAGYDVRLGGGNLYLTPNVDVLLQSFDRPGDDDTDAHYLFTLGIGFH